MNAVIKGFMGCHAAELTAEKIALVIGPNGRGKSSALRPVACALAGEAVPLGLKKQDAGLLVMTGGSKAEVTVTGEWGETSILWGPGKAELRTEGTTPPSASKVAAGLISPVDMDDKTRAEYLRDLLSCLPAKEDLEEKLKGVFSDKLLDTLWERIERDGWEASHKGTIDKGRDLKAQWGVITGETYGSKKAEIWAPPAWEDELTTASKDSLEAEVNLAKSALEDVIARAAVDENTRANLAAAAAKVPELEKSLADAGKRKKAAETALTSIKEEIAAMEQRGNPALCPHCNTPLKLTPAGALEIVESVSPEELEGLRETMAELKEGLPGKVRELELETRAEEKFKSDLVIPRQAAKELESADNKTIPADEVNARREAVRQAEAKLAAFLKQSEATRIHKQIVVNTIVAAALSESGVRKDAMHKGLKQFNETLGHVSLCCGWKDVEMDADLTARYDGRPYVVLSDGEKFRLRATLQIAIARIDKSDAIVIDGADILDTQGRGGLLRQLSTEPFVSFVGMMANSPDKVPNLAKLGSGRVYWMEEGCAREVL